MAKIQGLSLAPTKINGICGRLMCCLGYESDIYEEILKKMPKVNSEVKTPNGKGTVVYNDILRERVSVKRQAEGDTFVVEDFELDYIEFAGHPAKKVEEVKEEVSSIKTEEKVLEKPEKQKTESETKSEQTESDKPKNENKKHHHFRPKNKQKPYNNKNKS